MAQEQVQIQEQKQQQVQRLSQQQMLQVSCLRCINRIEESINAELDDISLRKDEKTENS